MEYRYQSIPHNCGILETARLKPIYGEYLECYGFGEILFEDLNFRAGDREFLAFTEETKKMREEYPGIEIRKIELGREREVVRSAIVETNSSMLLKAVDGGDILGVSITSTQGEPIRFLPPYVVKGIVEELDSGRILISEEIAEPFGKLADFYRISAAFDEGVVTIKL